MICCAEKTIQLRPAEGTSGESSICATTSAGFFIGDKMKPCSKCKETKPLSEFSKNRRNKDGLQNYCKSCKKAYDKQYHQTSNGKAVNCKAVAKYWQTTNGKASHRKAVAKHHALNPNYAKATNAVNHAIAADRLPRPDSLPCYYCPKPAQQYHHWHGYGPEFWLDVVPACLKCHTKEHRKIA